MRKIMTFERWLSVKLWASVIVVGGALVGVVYAMVWFVRWVG